MKHLVYNLVLPYLHYLDIHFCSDCVCLLLLYLAVMKYSEIAALDLRQCSEDGSLTGLCFFLFFCKIYRINQFYFLLSFTL